MRCGLVACLLDCLQICAVNGGGLKFIRSLQVATSRRDVIGRDFEFSFFLEGQMG